jgi:hypothetical protein
MCCCVADATTTEHKFLKRHNEKFEMIVNIGGSSLRVAGNHSARFSLALHVDDCAFVPRATKSKRQPATSSSKTDLFPGTVRHHGGSSSSSRGRREDLEQEQGTKSASTRSTTFGLPCVRS